MFIFKYLKFKYLQQKPCFDMNHKITKIFYLIDEFCKEFEQVKEGHVLSEETSKKRRSRKFKMSDSKVDTIVTLFHLKGYRCFKHFYIQHVQQHMKSDFPETVSYNRFIELQQKALLPMIVFLKFFCLGKCTGVSYRFYPNQGLSYQA